MSSRRPVRTVLLELVVFSFIGVALALVLDVPVWVGLIGAAAGVLSWRSNAERFWRP